MKKNIRRILLLLNFSFIIIFFIPIYFPIFWKIAWYILYIILLSRPLNDILNCKILNYIVSVRKELWILCWTFSIWHVVWYFLYYNISLLDILNTRVLNFNSYIFWWFVSLFFMFIPYFTSNSFSIKKLWFKKWKFLQRFTYLFFFTWAIHIIMVKPEYKLEIWIISVMLIILNFLSYKKKKKWVIKWIK